ncbi:hypothetical protein D5R81_09795 [Parashewanella spongiae]|uniref:Secreted protein n=1 Tax=Parashewanella spongiae TaxID=342950 RepID=A0A3A6UC73_9GAMM|nr:hypothetical protein [Parashewanella spongiae]MCL1078644.1 hypothetical protein [Parashewanella spongiae]RJY16319.1 hypothetical protein D5R81_09795 [Parashewanella spongiae]
MKAMACSAVFAVLLTSNFASAAIYHGQNIDNNYYHCSGTVTDTSGNSKSSDDVVCSFSGQSLTTSLTGLPKFTFTLESETITSNVFHFTKRVLMKKYYIDLTVDLDNPQQPSNFFFLSRKGSN